MGHLEPGDFVLLDYGESPRMWHMRLLLAPIQHTEFIVCTPDCDSFAEDVSLQNDDVSALRIMGRDGAAARRRMIRCLRIRRPLH